jgi:hypothetical protein
MNVDLILFKLNLKTFNDDDSQHSGPLIWTSSIETMRRNVAVNRLTLQLRIREISGSNLGAETGYPEDFHGFPQSFKVNVRAVPPNHTIITS